MMSRLAIVLACGLALAASPVHAQQTDLEALEVILTNHGQLFSVQIVIRNNGPDNYDDGTCGAAVHSLLAGGTSITVDIDEPAKPTPEDGSPLPDLQQCDPFPFNINEVVNVPIPAGSTTTVNLGIQDFEVCGRMLTAVASVAPASGTCADLDLMNNTTSGTFFFPTGFVNVPATRHTGLAFIALMIPILAGWALWSRRA